MSRRSLITISILSCLVLATAQGAALFEFLLIPAPTPETRGPQGSLDEALGLLAGLGGVIGVLLAATSGVFGMIPVVTLAYGAVAARRSHPAA